MRQKQAIKSATPVNQGDSSPIQTTPQPTHTQAFTNGEMNRLTQEISPLSEFNLEQIGIGGGGRERQRVSSSQQVNTFEEFKDQRIYNREDEIEDILDDSDEEKSIKDMNMFQIRSMEAAAAGGSSMGFTKNYSEHDFLHKELIKKNTNLMGQPQSNRIQLIVRIRPFLMTEKLRECLKVVNENGIRLFKEFHQMHFKFDNILMPKDTQQNVFSRVQGIVNGFLMGSVNGTIFAYGQTGAGKTYSIMGGDNTSFSSEKSGILPRTLDFVFDKLEKEMIMYENLRVWVSFYEIYNEKIYDLLAKKSNSGGGKSQSKGRRRSNSRGFGSSTNGQMQQQTKQDQVKSLELREEKDGQFSVPELKKVQIHNIQEAYHYLELGLQQRATSSTSLNTQSSRSHSIFQLYLEKDTQDSGITIKSKLRIVDLAGSEKYMIRKDLPTGEKNIKVQELTSINSSLSALGQCISALSDASRKHIPYRNSKLTKVLKDSLDENSNVALIICISPSIDSYKETLSTLQFADRAKKAILDGRNFSDSKLLIQQNQLTNHHSSDTLHIMKAYQEEKAIRKGLEQFLLLNNEQQQIQRFEVFEELERLKKQNKELQDKVKLLENHNPSSPSEHDLQVKKPLKSCLKQSLPDQQLNNPQPLYQQDEDPLISINIIQSSPLDQNTSNVEEDDTRKRVRFAEKLDNDQSLDSDDRERIEHNLKYNDDTIFDNISIFRDVNNSGIILHHRLVDKKDVHPSRLKHKPIESDEDEDEEEGKEKVSISDAVKEERREVQQVDDREGDGKSKDKEEQFWNVKDKEESKSTKVQHQVYDITNDNGVSPIQKRKPLNNNDENEGNNSSQEMSKDLIELDNDQALQCQLDQMNQSSLSNNTNLRLAQPTVSSTTTTTQQPFLPTTTTTITTGKNHHDLNKINSSTDEFVVPNHRNQVISDFVDDDPNIFEDEVDFNPNTHLKQDDQLLFINQSDSIMGVMDVDIDDNINKVDNNNENNSLMMGGLENQNQNTLFLDSQSMIIEAGGEHQFREQHSMSQQMMMQSFEASGIQLQHKESSGSNQNTQGQHNFFSVGGLGNNQQQHQYLGHNLLLQIGAQSSHANSSNHNTDVLTYSLTNTFSTIESLHDELTAIRNGLELSQKRGANILKTIHKYAKEIEESKVPPTEFYQSNAIQDEDIRSSNEEAQLDLYDEEEEKDFTSNLDPSVDFIQDIKGYYSKIHQEITQLKTILMDSAKLTSQQIHSSPLPIITSTTNNNKKQELFNSPISTTTHQQPIEMILSSSKQQPPPTSTSSLPNLSIQGIERTQDIIKELRSEMERILLYKHQQQQPMQQQQQQQQSKFKRKKKDKGAGQQQQQQQQSMRVLDLLEALQVSLIQQITPVKEEGSSSKKKQAFREPQSSSDIKLSKFSQMSKEQFINHKERSPSDNKQVFLKKQISHQEQLGSFKGFNNDLLTNEQRLFQNTAHHHLQQKQSSAVFPCQQPLDSKTLIHYEELPSQNSPSQPSSLNQHHLSHSQDPLYPNQHKHQQQHSSSKKKQRRTPEIFKSLAKLDDESMIDNNNQQVNTSQNNNTLGLLMNYYQSQQSQQYTTPNLNPNSQQQQDQQDLQITLRSYNVVGNEQMQQQQQNQSNILVQDASYNGGGVGQMIDRRKSCKSALGGENNQQQVATDNTLTLIFDSDEEDLQNNNEDDDPLLNDVPAIQEEDEDIDDELNSHHHDHHHHDDNDQSSLLFNDEDNSKIERTSSAGGNSRIINNLITSNSFQADNSLLFFANNIIINGSGGGGLNLGDMSSGSNNILKARNKSFHNKSRDEVTPERGFKDMKQIIRSSIGDKKANNKYLLPQSKKQPSVPLQTSLQPPLQQFPLQSFKGPHFKIDNTKSFKDQPLPPAFLTDDTHNNNDLIPPQISQSQSLTLENVNKSTSKNSVHKYWNQFFNNNNNAGQNNINNSIRGNLPNNTPNTRNHNPQQISHSSSSGGGGGGGKSAYQSKSQRDNEMIN